MRKYIVTASALIIRSLPGGVDTGRRLIRGQVVEVFGQDWAERWAYVRGPAGEGWSSLSFLERALGIPSSDSWPRLPNGLGEIRDVFGPECGRRASAGMVHLVAPIGAVTRFACHELMVPVFTSVFAQLYTRDLWDLLETFDGCYNCRNKTGTQAKPSTHSWGIAVDVNARTNGFGKKPTLDSRIVAIFKDHGFVWGGDWSTPDGMHFQYARGW